MRRSRIKALATVPARRKVTKDVPEQSSESANSAVDETPEAEKTVGQPPQANLVDEEQETPSPSLPSDAQSQESQPADPEPSENGLVSAASVDIEDPDASDKVPAAEAAVIEDSVNDQEVCTQNDKPATECAKASPGVDASPVAKVSQTRASFMRPTPRLDGGGRIRRNSVQGSGASASESEDDCRRVTKPARVRNDSLSSTPSVKGQNREAASCTVSGNSIPTVPTAVSTSTVPTSNNNVTSSSKSSSSSGVRQKRKSAVSESARKLAEARRDFMLKYEDKQPDRAKLTMYDLIYYNPVSNPMKRSEGSSAGHKSSSNATGTETSNNRQKENAAEDENQPGDAEEEEEEEEDCDGDRAMPVPQVKVGPDGLLVIDEQSLVIEQTGAKKNREALARTEALVDEEINGSGFYKRRQRGKDWPKWETLKFYKALNSVGTDFLLMQTLFPQRTRREIKLKFKKEEKKNFQLIEKALKFHDDFDMDALKEDLATFDETEKIQFESAKIQKTRQPAGTKRKRNKKSRRIVASSIAESAEESDEHEPSVEKTSPVNAENLLKVVEKKRIPGQRRSTQPANDERKRSELSTSSNESASDTEIYQVKPTRSGRLPKVRKLQAPAINTLDNLFLDPEQEQPTSPEFVDVDDAHPSVESETSLENSEITVAAANEDEKRENISNSVAGIENVEPGSLVIVSRESTDKPGETVLQVYMVSSEFDKASGNKQMTPVILTPELLNTVSAGITKVAPINVQTE